MSGGPAPLAGRPTLLQQAAAQGNVTLLSMLLNEEGLDINYSCEDGHSALYSAAKNGHTGKKPKQNKTKKTNQQCLTLTYLAKVWMTKGDLNHCCEQRVLLDFFFFFF
jgi:hypothetical protein